jgi:hypothetical protein
VARYYFHLVSEHEVILDREGVEVADLAEAGAEALKAVEELRQEGPSAATDWAGWWLEVTDASGVVVFSISLDGPN